MRAVAALALVSLAGAAPQPRLADDPFFVERHLSDGNVLRSSVHSVPFELDTACYGWHLHLAPSSAFRIIRERLVLPGPARHWNGGGGVQVDANGAGATSEVPVDPDSGDAENSWCVAEGDPRGAYMLELYDGRHLLRRIRFTVGLEEV